ncbi:hypothetical protein CWC22_020880 [Pseudoalteromonas rubra]|uniref:Uncharacterized protein n=1 Tax=Pseudoalteromonas rubra TaxID=43658 RepID=A0A5S3USM0_9GAMM|nr:hypothetical protein [Pseudoalteromonas rubra]MEC4088761.1 hypothetical protein [Pseudoalteromonas rubra]QPB85470.1 hypothetical protein CWC22_020880 [Pseudoalteromonas rubra]
MKTTIKAFALVAGTLFAGSAFSAQVVCDVYPKSNGSSWGNGTANCSGFDYSFGRTTNGRYYLKDVTKSIQEVRWEGDARCTGGTSCNATIRAYTSNKASALILYKDGTWERTNTASAFYETGH